MGMEDDATDRELVLIEVANIQRKLKMTPAVPAERIKLADPLIERVAFMTIQLKNLEREIEIGDGSMTEMYKQSEYGTEFARAKPAATLYNTLVKNFQSSWKLLNDLKVEAERNAIAKKQATIADKQAKATAELAGAKKAEAEALREQATAKRAEAKPEETKDELAAFLARKQA
jgi:hypothetical protein